MRIWLPEFLRNCTSIVCSPADKGAVRSFSWIGNVDVDPVDIPALQEMLLSWLSTTIFSDIVPDEETVTELRNSTHIREPSWTLITSIIELSKSDTLCH